MAVFLANLRPLFELFIHLDFHYNCSIYQTDDFDWIWWKGGTNSTNTGPSRDHTLNNREGHYVHIETSYPRKSGEKARLLSPIMEPKQVRNR